MIHIQNLSLAFGSQIIFNDLSTSIKLTSKVGLVGRNGSGKSTLLNVLAGRQECDSGTINLPSDTRIAFMPQEITLTSKQSLFEEALDAFPEIAKIIKETKTLEDKVHTGKASSREVEHYSHLVHDLLEHNADALQAEAKQILSGLGFKQEDFDNPVQSFSTGWRMRLILAKLLLQKADFYLFDEPTNHLDIFAREWFITFLKKSSFGFMIVSHERSLLDELCKTILEIEQGSATFYTGNYSSYEQQKEQSEELKQSAYANQQREIAQKKKTIERFRTKASKAKMAQSMIKSLDKIERVQVSRKKGSMALRFPTPQRSGRNVLEIQNIRYCFGDKEVFKNVSFDIDRGEKIVLIAQNGVGKTTLFNVITGKYTPIDGTIKFGHNVEHALFTQDADSSLKMNQTILDSLEKSAAHQTTSFIRTILGTFLFCGDDVKKKINVLSGGEKNRVRLAQTLLQDANFLLLDEPTNHLDLTSKEILAQALKAYEGTLFVVSHDPDFINTFATKILELTPNGIKSYHGNYNDYKYLTELDSKKSEETAKPKQKKNVSYATRKKIQSLERRLDKLQKKIDVLEENLKAESYDESFTETYNELQRNEREYHKLFEEWEELSEQN